MNDNNEVFWLEVQAKAIVCTFFFVFFLLYQIDVYMKALNVTKGFDFVSFILHFSGKRLYVFNVFISAYMNVGFYIESRNLMELLLNNGIKY